MEILVWGNSWLGAAWGAEGGKFIPSERAPFDNSLLCCFWKKERGVDGLSVSLVAQNFKMLFWSGPWEPQCLPLWSQSFFKPCAALAASKAAYLSHGAVVVIVVIVIIVIDQQEEDSSAFSKSANMPSQT